MTSETWRLRPCNNLPDAAGVPRDRVYFAAVAAHCPDCLLAGEGDGEATFRQVAASASLGVLSHAGCLILTTAASSLSR